MEEIKTLLSVLVQQTDDLMNQIGYLNNISNHASQLADVVGSTLDLNVQLKSFMATADIQLTAINSQDVLVQKTIDKISEVIAS